jgi:hypothetical protein
MRGNRPQEQEIPQGGSQKIRFRQDLAGNIGVRSCFPWKEAIMSKFHDKAEAQTKQIIGQMLGDELLVREGREQFEQATDGASSPGHGDQGIVRDGRGQEHPRDKERAQRVTRVDRGGDPPGRKA